MSKKREAGQAYSRDPEIQAEIRRRKFQVQFEANVAAVNNRQELPEGVKPVVFVDPVGNLPSMALRQYLAEMAAVNGRVIFDDKEPILNAALTPKETFAPGWKLTRPIQFSATHRGPMIVCQTDYDGAPYTLHVKRNPTPLANFQNGAGPNRGTFALIENEDGSMGVEVNAPEGSRLFEAEGLMAALLFLENSVYHYVCARIEEDDKMRKLHPNMKLGWLEAFMASR